MTQAETGTPEIEKKLKERSPAYPFISIKTALERAKAFFLKERRNAAPVSVAVKHWGYKEKSSGGIQTIAALKSYGLLSDTGSGSARKVQLTDLGLKIVMDERTVSPDRDALIKQAALMPKIHARLWRQYGLTPPSEENFRHHLRVDLKFNDNAVSDFIREYRDTISFAKLGDSDTLLEVEGDEPLETGEQVMQNQEVGGFSGASPGTGVQVIPPRTPAGKPVGASIPVTKNCSMSIMAVGEVTQKGIDQLVNYLELIKGAFPEDESTN